MFFFSAEPWTALFSCGFDASDICDWKNVGVRNDQDIQWTATASNALVLAQDGSHFALANTTEDSNSIARMLSPSINSATVRFQVRFLKMGN